MKILLVAATPFEIIPLQNWLLSHTTQKEQFTFTKANCTLQILITGVGQLQTAFWMGQVLAKQSFDLLLNAGIAGAYNKDLALGEVVNVVSETLGDLGAEDQDGSLLSAHDLGLIGIEAFPFSKGQLDNPTTGQANFLPKVKALTVNKASGEQNSIDKRKAKFDADIETMEGAAFFYAALHQNIPFLEIRAISNYVEVRNRDAWQLELAIEHLNKVLIEMVANLMETA